MEKWTLICPMVTGYLAWGRRPPLLLERQQLCQRPQRTGLQNPRSLFESGKQGSSHCPGRRQHPTPRLTRNSVLPIANAENNTQHNTKRQGPRPKAWRLSEREWGLGWAQEELACVGECVLNCFSHVRLFGTPWTVPARLLYPWDSPGKNTGVGSCPPPGDLPDLGIKPASPALQVDSLPLSHWGSPRRSLPDYETNTFHYTNPGCFSLCLLYTQLTVPTLFLSLCLSVSLSSSLCQWCEIFMCPFI